MNFLKYLTMFAVPLMATTYFSLPAQQPSPVAQFGSCFDYPPQSDTYTRCVSEHYAATDRFTASAVNQVGVGMMANMGRR